MKIYNLEQINLNNTLIKKDILAIIIAFFGVLLFSILFVVLYAYSFSAIYKILVILINIIFVTILFANIVDIKKYKTLNHRINLFKNNIPLQKYTVKIIDVGSLITLAKDVRGRKIKCEADGIIRIFNLEDIESINFKENDLLVVEIVNGFITNYEVVNHE